MHKALYGLKASGAMWHRKLADNLREMKFQPCTADHDFWIKDAMDHYEYIAVIVDDLLIFSKDGMKIINHMKEKDGYQFKELENQSITMELTSFSPEKDFL